LAEGSLELSSPFLPFPRVCAHGIARFVYVCTCFAMLEKEFMAVCVCCLWSCLVGHLSGGCRLMGVYSTKSTVYAAFHNSVNTTCACGSSANPPLPHPVLGASTEYHRRIKPSGRPWRRPRAQHSRGPPISTTTQNDNRRVCARGAGRPAADDAAGRSRPDGKRYKPLDYALATSAAPSRLAPAWHR
jgi:hypothetical protein